MSNTPTETTLHLIEFVKALHNGDETLGSIYQPTDVAEAWAMLEKARLLLANATEGRINLTGLPMPDDLPAALYQLTWTAAELVKSTGGTTNYLEALAEAMVIVSEKDEP